MQNYAHTIQNNLCFFETFKKCSIIYLNVLRFQLYNDNCL